MDLAAATLLLAIVATLASVGAVTLTYLGRPNALRRDVEQLADDVAGAERQLALAASERVEYMKAIESIHEAVRDDMERAESKRKQAAAKASKLGKNAEEPDWGDPNYLREVARQRGLL